MAINKVVYGNQTLVDLTSDTVTEQDVAQGVTFHDASGMLRTGSASGGAVIKEPMTLDDYQDAQSLDDGIYPIEDDAGTVLDASIIAYGNTTVERELNKLNNLIQEIPFSGTTDATGNIYISRNKIFAVGVEFTQQTRTGYCFIYGVNGSAGTYLRVLNNNNVLLPNTAVEGKIYYLSL